MTARAARLVGATPLQAFELWVDVRRWELFVDGFSAVESIDERWPAVGATVTWRSVPAGRGRVVERVTASVTGESFATDVSDAQLHGTQSVAFEPVDDGCGVTLALEYSLVAGGPLRWLTDVLFVRRALTDALRRTLARFAAETEEL